MHSEVIIFNTLLRRALVCFPQWGKMSVKLRRINQKGLCSRTKWCSLIPASLIRRFVLKQTWSWILLEPLRDGPLEGFNLSGLIQLQSDFHTYFFIGLRRMGFQTSRFGRINSERKWNSSLLRSKLGVSLFTSENHESLVFIMLDNYSSEHLWPFLFLNLKEATLTHVPNMSTWHRFYLIYCALLLRGYLQNICNLCASGNGRLRASIKWVSENLYIHCTLSVAPITRKYKHIRNMICKWQHFPGKVLLSQFCCLFQPEIGSFELQHSSWWLGGRYLCTVVRFASGNMAMHVTDSFDEVKLSWRNTDKSAGPAGWQPHDTSLAGSKGQTLPPHSTPLSPQPHAFRFLFLFYFQDQDVT